MDCDSKTLGSALYDSQVESGVPPEDRIGSRDQNPRSADSTRRSQSVALWDGISIGCPSEQIAAFLLGILLREICPIFPNSDRSHPSRHVLLVSKTGGTPRSVVIRWDTWQYTYVPILRTLFQTGREWSRTVTDLSVIEAHVRRVLESP